MFSSGLQAELAAKWREKAADLFSRAYDDPETAKLKAAQSNFVKRADALDRGEPVRVQGWELPASCRGLGRPYDVWVVESDGTLTPA